MRLRAIEIRAEEQAENRLGFHFGWSAHHVKELFHHHLPGDFSPDGAAQVTVVCGPRDDPHEDVYGRVDGASWLYREDFDFAAYKRSTPEARQEIVLDLLVDSFLRVSPRPSEALPVLQEAAGRVRADHFMRSVPTRLSRSTPDRAHKVEVTRNLCLDLGEAWSAAIVARSGATEATLWITERPGYLNQMGHMRKSHWVGGVFVIVDGLGVPAVRVDPVARTVERWGHVLDQAAVGPRYDRVAIDPRRGMERAIAGAGHAHKSGDFRSVVNLLRPYAQFLPPRQVVLLGDAERHIAE